MDWERVKEQSSILLKNAEGEEISGAEKADKILTLLAAHLNQYKTADGEDAEKFAASLVARDVSELAKVTGYEKKAPEPLSLKELNDEVCSLKFQKDMGYITEEDSQAKVNDLITEAILSIDNFDDGTLEEYVTSWSPEDIGIESVKN